MWFKRIIYLIAFAAGAGVLAFFFVVPSLVANLMNGVSEPVARDGVAAKTAAYDGPMIVDLHADSLLWSRDLSRHSSNGHIDLPRLLESGTGVQVFSAVTKTPRGLNFERNNAHSDNITALVIAQRWPIATWDSLSERALYQAERLMRLSDRAPEQLKIIRYRDELDALLRARASGSPVVGAVLAIEGMHAIEAERAELLRLYEAGYRMMGLTHFFDNAMGGSAHGMHKGGLTDFGRDMVAEMERLGIVIDLAHASPQLINDVLARATKPVVVSHTGVKGTCERTRNLSDTQLRAIAANGGVVGIAYFDEAVCGRTIGDIVRAVRYVVAQVGIQHVGFGSDFDGAVTTPFDVTGLPRLIRALRQSGFSPADLHAIAGGNALRVLAAVLPARERSGVE